MKRRNNIERPQETVNGRPLNSCDYLSTDSQRRKSIYYRKTNFRCGLVNMGL